MATYRLPEVTGDVCTGAVDDQRVEEDGVALLHVQLHSGVVLSPACNENSEVTLVTLITLVTLLTYAVIHLVNSSLPLRVVVLLQLAVVSPRLHHETTVVVVNVFHRAPGGHDPVGRPEGEVMKVLVERVAGGAGPGVRGFVDQHGVTGPDIWSNKTFHIVQHPGVQNVFRKDRVPTKVLDLVEYPLVRQACAIL